MDSMSMLPLPESLTGLNLHENHTLSLTTLHAVPPLLFLLLRPQPSAYIAGSLDPSFLLTPENLFGGSRKHLTPSQKGRQVLRSAHRTASSPFPEEANSLPSIRGRGIWVQPREPARTVVSVWSLPCQASCSFPPSLSQAVFLPFSAPHSVR